MDEGRFGMPPGHNRDKGVENADEHEERDGLSPERQARFEELVASIESFSGITQASENVTTFIDRAIAAADEKVKSAALTISAEEKATMYEGIHEFQQAISVLLDEFSSSLAIDRDAWVKNGYFAKIMDMRGHLSPESTESGESSEK